jgi:predicted DNA-binding ribbon-helix-helix protein
MKTSVAKRSIVIAGHKTSVSLEDTFWTTLKEIADRRHLTLSELVATIDGGRQRGNLSSAIRLFVLGFYRDQIPGRIFDESRPNRKLATVSLESAVAIPSSETKVGVCDSTVRHRLWPRRSPVRAPNEPRQRPRRPRSPRSGGVEPIPRACI